VTKNAALPRNDAVSHERARALQQNRGDST
jgi:hypothetical protein